MKPIMMNEDHSIGLASLEDADKFKGFITVDIDRVSELLKMIKAFESRQFTIGVTKSRGKNILALKPFEEYDTGSIFFIAPLLDVESQTKIKDFSKTDKKDASPINAIAAGECQYPNVICGERNTDGFCPGSEDCAGKRTDYGPCVYALIECERRTIEGNCPDFTDCPGKPADDGKTFEGSGDGKEVKKTKSRRKKNET